jgi:RNA polymerase sigma factor (sigma-70 family)
MNSISTIGSSAGSSLHNSSISRGSAVEGGSLSQLLDRWKAGDQAAAFAIYDRYYERLIRFAERQIGPKLRPVLTPESVALSVLDSLLSGIAKRGYKPDPSGSLMTPAKKIATNKIRKAWEYWTARIRNIGQRVHVDVLPEPTPSGSRPEDAITLADELSRIRQLLSSDDFEILALRLDGLSNPEIAERLGCTRQTVRRKMERLMQWLQRRANSGAGRVHGDKLI